MSWGAATVFIHRRNHLPAGSGSLPAGDVASVSATAAAPGAKEDGTLH